MSEPFTNQPPGWAVAAAIEQLDADAPWPWVAQGAWELVDEEEAEEAADEDDES